MHPQQPHVDDVPPRDEEPADATPPAAAARRTRRRLPVLVAAILAASLLAAVGITYLAGGFTDKGQFRAEPPACDTITPSLHLIGFPYTTRQTETNGCDLLLPLAIPITAPHPTSSSTMPSRPPARVMMRRKPPANCYGS